MEMVNVVRSLDFFLVLAKIQMLDDTFKLIKTIPSTTKSKIGTESGSSLSW